MTTYAERRQVLKPTFVIQWNTHCQNHAEPITMEKIKEDSGYISVFKCPKCDYQVAITLSASFGFGE